MERKAWIYRGVFVLPAGRNAYGIRWTANAHVGSCLRADSKDGMRELIRDAIQRRKRQ